MLTMRTLNELAATPEPPALLRTLATVGAQVTFMYSGCPGVYARRQVWGVVEEAKTTKAGASVLVRVAGLNLPKWVNVNRVQFVSGRGE